MMKQSTIINEVKPIFCLDQIKDFVDKEVWDYRDSINEALATYDHSLLPRSIILSTINPHLSARSSLKQITFEMAFQRYGDQKELLAETPYLLGLAKHQNFLRHFQDFQTIEVLENKPEGLFKGKIGKRPLQLCLRRSGNRYIVCISEYIQRGIMNFCLGRSTNDLRVLSFVKEEIEEDYGLFEDLSRKMIG